MINFIDANGKEKNARSIKIIKHSIRDAINDTTFDEDWIEITVVGRIRGEWKEYIKAEDFKKLNPELYKLLIENHGIIQV
jgi:hypothetical protein